MFSCRDKNRTESISFENCLVQHDSILFIGQCTYALEILSYATLISSLPLLAKGYSYLQKTYLFMHF